MRTAVRRLSAIGAARVAQRGAARVVAVLEQIEGLRGAARADVDGHHRFHAGDGAPAHELVGAKLVGLGRVPREVESHGPVGDGPHAVLPAIRGDEVAAGIADGRHAQFAHQLKHVAAEAVGVRGGVSGS